MGWNRPSEEKKVEKRGEQRNVHLKWLVAGAIVVLGASIAAWLLWPDASAPVREGADGTVGRRIKEVKPAVPKAATNAVAAVEEEEKDPSKRVVAVLSCETNSAFGLICKRVKTADGKSHKQYWPAREPMFKHATDDMISMLLAGRRSGTVLPIPMKAKGDLDKQFLASLNDPIVITDEDTEERAARKREVKAAREEIKEMMDRGLSFKEILADSRRLFQENAEIRRKAMRELQELHQKGDAEGERQYQVNIDAALQQMGIDPLDEPRTKEEVMADVAAKRAQREERRKQLQEQQKENEK